MPLHYFDAEGNEIGSINAGHPAPPDMIERIRSQPNCATVLDVPPLGSEHYHLRDGAYVLRPSLGLSVSKTEVAADETDAAVLTGVPAGSTVSVSGSHQGSFIAEGKPIAISFAATGPHEIRISGKGHRPERLTLTATALSSAAQSAPAPDEGHQQVVVGLAGPEYAALAVPAIDRHFDAVAASHATMLPMQDEANKHLRGDGSDRIAALADAAGLAPDDAAREIVRRCDAYWDAQGQRAALKARLQAMALQGARRTEIDAALDEHGILVNPSPGLQGVSISSSTKE